MNSYIPKDWRIWFALSLTFFWFCFLVIYMRETSAGAPFLTCL